MMKKVWGKSNEHQCFNRDGVDVRLKLCSTPKIIFDISAR